MHEIVVVGTRVNVVGDALEIGVRGLLREGRRGRDDHDEDELQLTHRAGSIERNCEDSEPPSQRGPYPQVTWSTVRDDLVLFDDLVDPRVEECWGVAAAECWIGPFVGIHRPFIGLGLLTVPPGDYPG